VNFFKIAPKVFVCLFAGTMITPAAQPPREKQPEPAKQAQPAKQERPAPAKQQAQPQQQRAEQPRQQAQPQQQQQKQQVQQPRQEARPQQQQQQRAQQPKQPQQKQQAQQPNKQAQPPQQQQRAQQPKQQAQPQQQQQRAQQPKQAAPQHQQQRVQGGQVAQQAKSSGQRSGNYAPPQRSTQQAQAWQQKSGWKQSGAWQGGASFQAGRASNWSSEHRTWGQRGGYGGYYIPEASFGLYFGAGHLFRIGSQPFIVGGYPEFRYGGYTFMMVDPWPSDWSTDWYDSDQLYVAYDDGYYLYDQMHPGEAVALTVVM
jgi:hypothetical protein